MGNLTLRAHVDAPYVSEAARDPSNCLANGKGSALAPVLISHHLDGPANVSIGDIASKRAINLKPDFPNAYI